MNERERLLAKADTFAAEKARERELATNATTDRDRHKHWQNAEIAFFGEKSARTLAEVAQ